MNGIGKAVWILLWPAAAATPIWWVLGSALTGGGWNSLFVIFLAFPTFLVLLIGPIIGTAARRYRTAHEMPVVFSFFTLVQWLFGLIWPLTVTSGGDDGVGPSALGALGIPESAVVGIGLVCLVGFFIALLCALVSLIVARSLPKRAAVPVSPPSPPLGSEP
jgi:hypothetical protein